MSDKRILLIEDTKAHAQNITDRLGHPIRASVIVCHGVTEGPRVLARGQRVGRRWSRARPAGGRAPAPSRNG